MIVRWDPAAKVAAAGYDERAARDARRRIVAFFRTHLAGDEPE